MNQVQQWDPPVPFVEVDDDVDVGSGAVLTAGDGPEQTQAHDPCSL